MALSASVQYVRDELMYEWEEDDEGINIRGQQLMTRDEVEFLMTKHKKILNKGIRLGSNASYVADEILKAERERLKTKGEKPYGAE